MKKAITRFSSNALAVMLTMAFDTTAFAAKQSIPKQNRLLNLEH